MYTYQYPRPAVTTDIILFRVTTGQKQILLIQRGIEPYRGMWALPGGFVEMDELLADACLRELEEETGLKLKTVTQFKTYDAVKRDPRGRTLSVVFSGFLEDDQPLKAGDDAKNAQWFSLKELPDLAFDHQLIIEEFLSANK